MGAGASADKAQLSDATQEALDALPHEVQQELEALLPRLTPRLCAPAAVLAEDTYNVGDKVFFNGPCFTAPNGERAIYGESVVVTALAEPIRGHPVVCVKFESGENDVPCSCMALSRTKPPEEFSNDRYRVGTKVEYIGEDKTAIQGEVVAKGCIGTVLGPDDDGDPTYVHVNFEDRQNNSLILLTEIRRLVR